VTAYNVINPSSLQAGQPEDVSVVLANLNAIAAILNGGIDNSNLAAAAGIQPAKIAGYPADGSKALKGDGSWGSTTPPPPTTNPQVASYVLAITDANNIVEILNAGAVTLTIPPNATVAFPIGTSITVIQTGAGIITITAGAGVTLNVTPGPKTATQWAAATLLKRATDTWVAMGNLTP
jgi:hypothetical protein